MGIYLWLMELVNISEWQALTDFLTTQDQTIRNVLSIVGVVICIIGLLQCFLGYKLFRIWCGIVGFFIGVLLAIALATTGILHESNVADLISVLLIIVLGTTGALIANKVYLVGLFIYAFSAVFIIGFVLTAVFTSSLLACLVVGILAGTAMGVLVVIHRRFWIILMTSIQGGLSVCTGLMLVMQSTELGFAFILPPVLSVAGFFVQYFFDKKDGGKTVKTKTTIKETKTTVVAAHADTPAQTETPSPTETPEPTESPEHNETQKETEEPAQAETPEHTETQVAPEGEESTSD